MIKLASSFLFLLFTSFSISAASNHPSKQTVDLIVEGDIVVTLNADDLILSQGAVAIHQGEIQGVAERSDIHQRFTAETVIPGEGRILMPGLINGHSHMAMTLLRGLADDLNLMTWLNDFIFPAEVKFVDEDFVRTGTDLACWEMLEGGTTTVVDMYYYPDVVAQSLTDCGMRGIVAATVINQESPDAKTAEKGLSNAAEFVRRWKDRNTRITPALGPHAIYTTPPSLLLDTQAVATELNVPLSMHMAESQSEIEFSVSRYGKPTVSLLQDIGFFETNVPIIGAHMVWPSLAEMELLAANDIGSIYNPTSNMKISAGVSPVTSLQAQGVTVGLGTDGAASNNDLDMWEEMRLATLLQKITHADATLLPARQVLRMATIDGASAIGLGEVTGSLEVGKRGDMIQVQLAGPHMQPIYDVVSHLVYVADSQDVVTVVVDGQQVVKDGEVLNIDVEKLVTQVKRFQKAIRASILESVVDE